MLSLKSSFVVCYITVFCVKTPVVVLSERQQFPWGNDAERLVINYWPQDLFDGELCDVLLNLYWSK